MPLCHCGTRAELVAIVHDETQRRDVALLLCPDCFASEDWGAAAKVAAPLAERQERAAPLVATEAEHYLPRGHLPRSWRL